MGKNQKKKQIQCTELLEHINNLGLSEKEQFVPIDDEFLDETIISAYNQRQNQFCEQLEKYLIQFVEDEDRLQDTIGNMNNFQRKVVHKICERFYINREFVEKLPNDIGNITIAKTPNTAIPKFSCRELYQKHMKKQFQEQQQMQGMMPGMMPGFVTGQVPAGNMMQMRMMQQQMMNQAMQNPIMNQNRFTPQQGLSGTQNTRFPPAQYQQQEFNQEYDDEENEQEAEEDDNNQSKRNEYSQGPEYNRNLHYNPNMGIVPGGGYGNMMGQQIPYGGAPGLSQPMMNPQMQQFMMMQQRMGGMNPQMMGGMNPQMMGGMNPMMGGMNPMMGGMNPLMGAKNHFVGINPQTMNFQQQMMSEASNQESQQTQQKQPLQDKNTIVTKIQPVSTQDKKEQAYQDLFKKKEKKEKKIVLLDTTGETNDSKQKVVTQLPQKKETEKSDFPSLF